MSGKVIAFAPRKQKAEPVMLGELRETPDTINFGDLPEEIDDLLQQGVVAYRRDRQKADALFRQALDMAPQALPVYYCLYKIHTYQGNLDKALEAAEGGLKEAATQAGWSTDWRQWVPEPVLHDGAGRFALYTLKALSFIHLRRHEREEAMEKLAALQVLDPSGAVGWPVIADLASQVD